MIDTIFLLCAPLIFFYSFERTRRVGHENWSPRSQNLVKKQRNNYAIFGPFLDLQEFFQNRGLSCETSDSDFRDLLDEFFQMNKKIFEKKIKIADLISMSHIKPTEK